jgi:transcriptional regulator
MYPDKKFLQEDREQIRAFLERYPFATILAVGADGEFAATHLPLLIERWDERTILRGHLMRDTDHWRAIKHAGKVFVSFLGPDAPILGSWQSTPRFGGTWNYQAVQVRGRVEGRDRATLLAHLELLKNRFETSKDHRFDSLPQDYVQALVPMIECIDIVVSDLKCIFKLSQNRKLEEFDRTRDELHRQGGKAALVAAEMQQQRQRFFGI